MSLAPIILFCYQRVDTLKLCIESLLACPESKNSDLIIISDAPSNDEVVERINSVRKYLKSINGFKSIEIIEREKNLGVDYNIINGLVESSKRFDKFIVLEDDIIVKSDCLTFFNSSLEYYEKNETILGISGFSFFNKVNKNYQFDVFFAGRLYPWGWATWSNKIKHVDWEIEDRKSFINSSKKQKEFNEWGSDMSQMLKNTFSGKVRAWDIRLDYHLYNQQLFIVYPNYSYTENIGFGRSDSSNTTGYNRYKIKLSSGKSEKNKFPMDVFIDEGIKKKFQKKNSVINRIFTRLMKLIRYNN